MVMIWQKIDYFVRIKQREFPETVVTSCTDYRYEIVKIKIRIYHDFKNAYKHFIELLLNDDSELLTIGS